MNVRVLLSKSTDKYRSLPVSARAVFWFMICNVFQRVINIITTPLFTRLLTTTEYGQYTLFQSWLTILTLICTFRLTFSVFTKGMSKFKDERNEFTASIQTTMTIITTAVLLIYLIVHNWVI